MATFKERLAAKKKTIADGRAATMRPYKFKAGKTSFRILPAAKAGDDSIFGERPFGMHYLKTLDEQNFCAIADRKVCYGEEDPIRNMVYAAVAELGGDADTKKHYLKMLASSKYLFNVLILDDKDQDPKQPVLIELSETAFDTILSQFETWADDNPEYDLAGQEEGHIFVCEKTGSGMQTKYNFTATPKKAPVSDAILEKAVDVDNWIEAKFAEGETRAVEFLEQLNGAVGITVASPSSSTQLTDQSSGNGTGTDNGKVITNMTEDEDDVDTGADTATDAEVEEQVEETVAETTDEPAGEVEAEDTASAESDDIDDILNSLK